MMRIEGPRPVARMMLFNLLAVVVLPRVATAQATLNPQTMVKVGDVDPRFVSYNVETVEVTGGRFWKPYNAEVEARLAGASQAKPGQNQPVGMEPKSFSISPADRPEQYPAAKAHEGPGTCIPSGEWNVAQQHLLPGR